MTMRCEFDALQIKSEMEAFINILKKENVTSYLEIGSRCGGSLWPIANALPKGATVVAVDLGARTKTVEDSKPHLIQCVETLKKKGYAASVFFGDSTSRAILDQVYSLGPYDALFIDGNHTRQYVEADWKNYSPIIRKIVAFHDINWKRPEPQPPTRYPIEVPAFWEALRDRFVHEEFRHDKQDNGIGVLWL